ncbi:DUF1707 domain-containing protein [Yinghuangia sp. ASG 101]|uniref:DUF1707 domain-containing protein n=1 Tax=Yinghuangia sp. ASG 101 TaxID=2896848 RepID=UPI001E416AFD|nr:DUF1707 domain-containing protein [Yinghuangia sp. ASG 101]UGQ14602.1 DUF1707 domain-containing protein [Yinghuangia sp. ASG 101]
MDGDGGGVTAEDRERATEVLRERMASGRLSLAEYQARLRRVKAAATAADLDAVVRDLSAGRDADERDDGGPPSAGPPETAPAPEGRSRAGCAGTLVVLVAAARTASAAYRAYRAYSACSPGRRARPGAADTASRAVRSATRFHFSWPRALD